MGHYYSSSLVWSSSRQYNGPIIILPVISGVSQGSVLGPLLFFQSSLELVSWAHYYSSSHLWSSSRQCLGPIIILPVISGVPQGSVLGPLFFFQSSLEFLKAMSWAHYYSSSHLWSSSRQCLGPIIILSVISGVPQGNVLGPLLFFQSSLELLKAVSWVHYYF